MVQQVLEEALRHALIGLGVEPVPAVIPIQPSDHPDHGHWSSSVALASARAADRKPRQLAESLRDAVAANPPAYVTKVEVAGPGFLNFWLDEGWLHDALRRVLGEGVEGYGSHALGVGTRVNVEFVSANPTGPLHVGAGRWAVYGDALCRIMERCGYEVHREYYFNDRGTQMTLFGQSIAAARAGIDPPEGGYRGGYIAEWARDLPEDGDPLEWGYARAREDIASTLAALGVRFDSWFSERSMVGSGAIDAALEDLRSREMVYEADRATWLRTTDFGLGKDEVLIKSDGQPTYYLTDLAYHRDKFERGFDRLIDIWGSDHHGHVARLKAGVQALGHDSDEVEILLGQLVTVQRGGEAVRMGKRSGTFVELADVLEEVGPDVSRLTFLLQSISTRQTFDLDSVVSRSMDNPVFYVQYAHARIASISRVAAEQGVRLRPLDDVDLGLLLHERELDILRSLASLPEVVLEACASRAPHKVATWVRELAGRFHGFYHDCRVLGEGVDPELTQARLWLVEAARVGLAVGLGLLGVSAPESM
ncbi:MAG: arginine--tRNA ligase [Actinobacteria bacterium]|nr:arginine--tRNA ligase [Actinomycetota bacterium]